MTEAGERDPHPPPDGAWPPLYWAKQTAGTANRPRRTRMRKSPDLQAAGEATARATTPTARKPQTTTPPPPSAPARAQAAPRQPPSAPAPQAVRGAACRRVLGLDRDRYGVVWGRSYRRPRCALYACRILKHGTAGGSVVCRLTHLEGSRGAGQRNADAITYACSADAWRPSLTDPPKC